MNSVQNLDSQCVYLKYVQRFNAYNIGPNMFGSIRMRPRCDIMDPGSKILYMLALAGLVYSLSLSVPQVLPLCFSESGLGSTK